MILEGDFRRGKKDRQPRVDDAGSGKVIPFARGEEIRNNESIASIEERLERLRKLHAEVEEMREWAVSKGDDAAAHDLLGYAIRLEVLMEKGEMLHREGIRRGIELLEESFETMGR